MAIAYEGDKPYIFISYAHKDKAEVLRYIDALQAKGFRIWFDKGIEAGSEWPEYIGNHLAKSACVVAFVSENFVESKNCREELTLSEELKKDQLNVYIQNIKRDELPMGVRLQSGLNQAMFRENFDNDESFIEELSVAPILQDCLGDAVQEETVTEPVKLKGIAKFIEYFYCKMGKSIKDRKDNIQRACKTSGVLGILLELVYIPLSTNMIIYTIHSVYGSMRIVNMLVLWLIAFRVGVALINGAVLFIMKRLIKRAGIDKKLWTDARVYIMLAMLATTGVAVFLSVEGLLGTWLCDDSYFAALGTSFRMHAIPFLGSLCLYTASNFIRKPKK